MVIPRCLFAIMFAAILTPSWGSPQRAHASRPSVPGPDLSSTIGLPVYACADSPFYEFELPGPSGAVSKQGAATLTRRIDTYDLLQPLVIRKVVAIGGVFAPCAGKLEEGCVQLPSPFYTLGASVNRLILIVEFPGGRLLATPVTFPKSAPFMKGQKLLDWVLYDQASDDHVLPRAPLGISKSEYKDIEWGSLRRGMSAPGVLCEMGHPEEINDYGRGGKQWVYDGGKTLVYFDAATSKVTDVQHLDPGPE